MTRQQAKKIAKEIAIYIRQHGYSTVSAINVVYIHNGLGGTMLR